MNVLFFLTSSWWMVSILLSHHKAAMYDHTNNLTDIYLGFPSATSTTVARLFIPSVHL